MVKRGLPDEDLAAVKAELGALNVFLEERGTMPVQYITAFLLVAEEEGLGVGDYAKRANVSMSVMSRHLLDIGERDRYGDPGFGWVSFRINPMELRKKEYFLTDRGRSLVHKMKRQLERVK
jgi:DNA-binding MarR family transcriptional regulator